RRVAALQRAGNTCDSDGGGPHRPPPAARDHFHLPARVILLRGECGQTPAAASASASVRNARMTLTRPSATFHSCQTGISTLCPLRAVATTSPLVKIHSPRSRDSSML